MLTTLGQPRYPHFYCHYNTRRTKGEDKFYTVAQPANSLRGYLRPCGMSF